MSKLVYLDEVNITERALLGDAAVIGSSDRCLVASSRLNKYGDKKYPNGSESEFGRDWSGIRWG